MQGLNVPVPASRIFEHLATSETLRITRHQMGCGRFLRLRHAIYGLIVGLRDDDSGDVDLSDRLRQSLSEWLTVPVPFEQLVAPVLDELSDPALVGQRWGEEARRFFEDARESLTSVRASTNPLRAQLTHVLRDATANGADWRIYCHRSSVNYFTSCLTETGQGIEAARFIHSLRDYRCAEPFELLIKVGPLRRRGWSSFINAALSAPRYTELIQVVWEGMSDEPSFGENPIVALFGPSLGGRENLESSAGQSLAARREYQASYALTVVDHPDLTAESSMLENAETNAIDELAELSQLGRAHSVRHALMLHFDRGVGVLYPPNAEILLLDPSDPTPNAVGRAVLAEADDIRGRFLIRADIGDVNLGTHLTESGWYSSRWKAELERQFRHHPEGLIRKLRAAGMSLRNLRGCVEHWMHPASTVIHAPQQRKHFRILIDVLEMDLRAERPASTKRSLSWWEEAWLEIAESRGTAIQTGMHEQEIIGEEVDREVFGILSEIRERASAAETFRIAIPAGHSLEGSISCYPIHDVEVGFRVPEAMLKCVIPTSGAEQWRV